MERIRTEQDRIEFVLPDPARKLADPIGEESLRSTDECPFILAADGRAPKDPGSPGPS